MRYLTAEEILALHLYLMVERWHERLSGLRDEGLLESAAAPPLNAAEYDNADVFDQAARLWEGITVNHPFVQGNKRTAYAAMEVFLRLNGWMCDASDGDLIDICLGMATGKINADPAAVWLRSHTRRAPKQQL